MGTIKDRNGKYLTEAEDIKKRWKENTEELYNKNLNDLDNHHDVVSHSEPDILECEVKWALGSMAAYKAARGDGIPAELFKIQNDLNCCTQYVSKFGKSSSGHRTGKGQSSSQFPRKAVLKNIQSIRQLHSSPMLLRLCSKSFMLCFSIMWTENLQMSKLDLEKAEELEIKLPTSVES